MASKNRVWQTNIYGMYPADIPQDLLSVANRLPHGINYGHYIVERSQRMVRFTGSYRSYYDGRPHCLIDFTIEVPRYQGCLLMDDIHIKLYRDNKVCDDCFHGLDVHLWAALEKSLGGG